MAEVAISIIALIIAAASMFFAREQVRLAKKTKSETEQLLVQIDAKVRELKSLTSTIKQNVEDTIKELISNSNENFVKLLEKLPDNSPAPEHSGSSKAGHDTNSADEKLMEAILPGILEKAMDDPENFDKFMQNIEKFGKK